MFILFFFHLYRILVLKILCLFGSDDVCEVLLPCTSSHEEKEEGNDDCDQYQGWQTAYFISLVSFPFLVFIKVHSRLLTSKRLDENELQDMESICNDFSRRSVFEPQGYFVEFLRNTQKVEFRNIVSDNIIT